MHFLLQSPSNFIPSVTSLNTPTWPKPQIENLECEPILIPCLPIMEALLDLLFQDRSPFAFSPILDPTQDFRIEVWLGVGHVQTSNFKLVQQQGWSLRDLRVGDFKHYTGASIVLKHENEVKSLDSHAQEQWKPTGHARARCNTKVGQLSLLQRKNQHARVDYMDP